MASLVDALAGLIDALKSQPALLALSASNLVILVFLFYALSSAAGARDLLVKQITDNASSIHELLARGCVPPTP